MTSTDDSDVVTKHIFGAEVVFDETLKSTVITLFYRNKDKASSNISVSIAPDLGSNMFRFRVGEYDLIYCEQELLKRKEDTGNFVLWPLPNRVRDRQYTYQGHPYSLDEVKRWHRKDALIHGLVLDRQWHYETPIQQPDGIRVTTFVEIKPGSPSYDAYPFDSRLALTYTLTANGVTISYEVRNQGTKDLPFGFALHPYFSTLSDKSETLISVPAHAVMEADNALLPTGRVLSLDGIMYAMFDLREPVPVGNLKLDHVYIEVDTEKSAVIEYKKQHMRLRLSTSDDFTHVVVFALPDASKPYFCLENQTCSTDAVNLHARGFEEIAHLLEVHPGERSTGSIQYTIDYVP